MSERHNSLWAILTLDPSLMAAAAAILLFAIGLYFAWFRSTCSAVQGELQTLSKALRSHSDDWHQAREAIRSTRWNSASVPAAWAETEDRIVELDTDSGVKPVMFGLPRDLWNPTALLGRRINVQLADAVPNLLVGVGLLFTFFFLALAISSATEALQPGSDSKQAMPALTDLLKATGAKFATSLAGLLSSIVWTIAARGWMTRLAAECEAMLGELKRFVRTDAAEFAMRVQLGHSKTQTGISKTHVDVASDHLATAKQQGDVLAELLEEAREQTGTFKRFETDLAVSLAKAINTALAPKFEEMTKQLIGSIDGLSDKLGMMNQDALRKMTEEFSAMLQRMTESELGQLKDALQELSGKLKDAGGVFLGSAEGVGGKLEDAGKGLADQVAGITGQLTSAADTLSKTATTFDGSLVKLGETVDRAAESGSRGVAFVDGAVDEARQALERLSALSVALQAAAADLQKLSGRVADAVDSVDELSAAQKEVVQAVKEAAPAALASVGGVVQTLSTAVAATESSMTRTKDAMTATATSLNNTVAQITAGVTEYSKTIADLHGKMDEYLARAVGSLGKSIDSLDESVEELAEVVNGRPKGRA
jgi:chromosome segregation ATPase